MDYDILGQRALWDQGGVQELCGKKEGGRAMLYCKKSELVKLYNPPDTDPILQRKKHGLREVEELAQVHSWDSNLGVSVLTPMPHPSLGCLTQPL